MSVDQLTDRAECSRPAGDVALTDLTGVILCDGSQGLQFIQFFIFFWLLREKTGLEFLKINKIRCCSVIDDTLPIGGTV